MKYLLLICDGMDDEPIPVLGGKTPQEAADTPHMDWVARMGRTGTLSNCPEGITPGSDSAIMTLLGYPADRYRLGRAALEAAGLGICPGEGQMAVRANLVSWTGEEDISSRRLVSSMGLDGQKALAAARRLLEDEAFVHILKEEGGSFYPQPSFRQILTMPCWEGTLAAPHENPGAILSDVLPNHPSLRKLMLRSAELFRKEGLGLWFWGSGRAEKLPPFPCKAAMISATPVCRGIGRLAGMEVPDIPGGTGTLDTDYEAKARAAVNAWETGIDFVAVHVEAPDACSHARDPEKKAEAIRRIDSRLLGPLLSFLEKGGDYRVLVLSDHRTLCRTGGHDAAPVPFFHYCSDGIYPVGPCAAQLLLGIGSARSAP